MPPGARRSAFRLPVFSLTLLVATTGFGFADDRTNYDRDVRPILSDTCYKCHGPDAAERKAGLRLDSAEGATVRLESGVSAIVPGKADESELLKRILSTDPDLVMPPPESGMKLTPQQQQKLTKWIEQGAEFKGHWSFIRPQRPALPAVSDEAWCRNPIDRFVMRKLDEAGLKPSPEADRAALIRRVTLDLTGLPPTPSEVQAFQDDPDSKAYEKVVDRLLASPRYGEQMTRYWLDLVRYGDSHGLHLDNERSLWKYREWVINAFNSNKPFDQFTIEQLAGDLLPDSTMEQKIATGFNRCNVTTSEGGSINEEVLVRYAVDRTETMSTIFMGMTLGCAVCHDHKFDPVTQKEFYQLFAFYNAAADAAMDGNALAPPPTIRVPTAEQSALLAELDQKIPALNEQINTALAAVDYVDPGVNAATVSTEPAEFVWIDDAAPTGAQLQGDTAWEFVSAPDHPVHSGTKATRRQAAGLSQHFFTGANPTLKIGEGDKLFAYCWLDPANPPKTVMLQFNDGVWSHRAFWGEDLIPFDSGTGENHRPMGPLPKTGEWVRLEVDAAQVGLKAGAELNGWAFTQFGGLAYWDTAGIVTRTPQADQSFESLLAWEAFDRSIEKSSVPQPVRDAIKIESDKRTPDQSKLIREHFLRYIHPKTRVTFEPLQKQLDEVTQKRTAVDAAIAVTMVMADLPQPRDTFVLKRGEYDKPGEKVEANVPAMFPPLPEGAPRNRLGLAKWLVDPSHPLTARVTVNRYWQQYFGTGIVKTAEDFGKQGQWPTNPALLDWLAVEFIESGWDIKALQKLIVTSSVYRQASSVSPELLATDPDNELLARGPRFRLDAEVVRDSALAVSGLLVEVTGGKSVRPYQPDGIWESVAFVGSTTQNYKRDEGDALYRRSLYTFWKRTAPPPSLMAFDAPSRETCVARRARTNTPLQALVLMNDTQYVEASRKLAARMLSEGGDTAASRLSFGFQLCTARMPTEQELDVLTQVHSEQLSHYKENPAEADKLLVIGASPRADGMDSVEHAAMTMMANLMLNLDETITRE
ncbi:MAG TPA: PSD1 and planctomycete cytochrome C domain-containing protein [Planctomycetaceae bacterium]|nr:PSD1 and planctomycete cytochrome C domain-containing protein [Planctomycetaceae bacterium]